VLFVWKMTALHELIKLRMIFNSIATTEVGAAEPGKATRAKHVYYDSAGEVTKIKHSEQKSMIETRIGDARHPVTDAQPNDTPPMVCNVCNGLNNNLRREFGSVQVSDLGHGCSMIDLLGLLEPS
jgi:hypothetical protein